MAEAVVARLDFECVEPVAAAGAVAAAAAALGDPFAMTIGVMEVMVLAGTPAFDKSPGDE